MSVHWILALTVTLLHCGTSYPKPTVQYTDIKLGINRLKQANCTESDAKFYSPSGTEECIVKALDCSIQELETVRTECFAANSRETQLVNRTRDLIIMRLKEKNIILQADSDNCLCGEQKLAEKPHKEFLDNILILLQKLNSSQSPKEA